VDRQGRAGPHGVGGATAADVAFCSGDERPDPALGACPIAP
jgi:hypothetical protein